MAWALNSEVYCFLGLLGVMSGFWCLLVQKSSAPQFHNREWTPMDTNEVKLTLPIHLISGGFHLELMME